MDEYRKILTEIDELTKQMQNTSLSDIDKKLIEIKIGDLSDQAKRMTFNIAYMEEDNYV